MLKIIVIGKSGQLAQELAQLSTPTLEVHCLGRHDVNILSKKELAQKIQTITPDAIINAAAYTAVDKAEEEFAIANDINGTAVKYLAEICALHPIYLVHISTDFVFSGDKTTPYTTTDELNPINTYGKSKALGENYLAEIASQNSCIIRTAWVYSTFGNNFVKTMLNLMESKPELNIIADQIGTPTNAKYLAHACLVAIQKKLTGIYHWTDQGVASWYDFAVAIQTIALDKGLLTKAIPINPIPSSEYPTPAARPSFSVLDKYQNKDIFPSHLIKHWHVHLDEMLTELKLQRDK